MAHSNTNLKKGDWIQETNIENERRQFISKILKIQGDQITVHQQFSRTHLPPTVTIKNTKYRKEHGTFTGTLTSKKRIYYHDFNATYKVTTIPKHEIMAALI